ncbi:MAG TPA: hypothetical protein VFC53_02300 [Dehalococcoidia bacterium]|nr:hypothetical protein [Dehalococcoidia bacterium]
MALGASGVLSYLRARLYSFYKVERGQDLLEYAVLAGAIGIAIFVALITDAPFADAITTFSQKIAACISFNVNGSTCDFN